MEATRWGIGSWKRIVHALALGLLQPVVPIALFVGLAPLLFDKGGELVSPSPMAFAAVALVAAVAVTALIFAAWHPPRFALPSFLIRLVLGLVTGACRGRDRPLTGAIVAHALLWPVVGLS